MGGQPCGGGAAALVGVAKPRLCCPSPAPHTTEKDLSHGIICRRLSLIACYARRFGQAYLNMRRGRCWQPRRRFRVRSIKPAYGSKRRHSPAQSGRSSWSRGQQSAESGKKPEDSSDQRTDGRATTTAIAGKHRAEGRFIALYIWFDAHLSRLHVPLRSLPLSHPIGSLRRWIGGHVDRTTSMPDRRRRS